MQYAKTPLEIALDVYRIDPRRLGETQILRIPFVQVGATSTGDPKSVTSVSDRLLLALSAQPNDGAAASYAGLELEFFVGDRFFATDGKSAQFVQFSALAGRGPQPSQTGGPWYVWELPLLVPANTIMGGRAKNTTAGALTPSVYLKTIELRPK